MSLGWKITLVGLLPLLFFCGLAIYDALEDHASYENAKQTGIKLKLAIAASKMVDLTQQERGLSASFLNGGIEKARLVEHRAKNDRLIENVVKAAEASTFPVEYKRQVLQSIQSLRETREKLDSQKINLGQTVKSYTKSIQTLLGIQLEVAKFTDFRSVSDSLRSLSIIEDVKENAGKLRANLSSIFAKDAGISVDKLNLVRTLKQGVDYNVNSKALVISEEAGQIIDEFKNSEDWKFVLRSYNTLNSKFSVGGYGINAEQFFDRISGAIAVISKLIDFQITSLEKELAESQELALLRLRSVLLALGCAILILFGTTIFLVRRVSGQMNAIVETLRKNISEVLKTSSVITDNSQKLSRAVSSQVAGIHQTVSSIDQISSVISNNAENAVMSSQKSSENIEHVLNGKQTLERMAVSITKIAEGNDVLKSTVESNNREFSSIVQIMEEISKVTNVINDIVFQTKLLSFNASVEAARAGEHGKGFSVVAEEVGNLAGKSGESSSEISTRLSESKSKVDSIIGQSAKKVEDLMNEGKKKVESSIKISEECNLILSEVEKSTNMVNEMMKQISEASTEQSHGVDEIRKTMKNLSEITKSNSQIAELTSKSAEDLLNRAAQLKSVAKKIEEVVRGKSSKTEFDDEKLDEELDEKLVEEESLLDPESSEQSKAA